MTERVGNHALRDLSNYLVDTYDDVIVPDPGQIGFGAWLALLLPQSTTFQDSTYWRVLIGWLVSVRVFQFFGLLLGVGSVSCQRV